MLVIYIYIYMYINDDVWTTVESSILIHINPM